MKIAWFLKMVSDGPMTWWLVYCGWKAPWNGMAVPKCDWIHAKAT